jgi:hypothetical protein
MSESQIEVWVERQVDRLDRKYINSELTTEDYHDQLNKIYERAKRLYTGQHAT